MQHKQKIFLQFREKVLQMINMSNFILFLDETLRIIIINVD